MAFLAYKPYFGVECKRSIFQFRSLPRALTTAVCLQSNNDSFFFIGFFFNRGFSCRQYIELDRAIGGTYICHHHIFRGSIFLTFNYSLFQRLSHLVRWLLSMLTCDNISTLESRINEGLCLLIFGVFYRATSLVEAQYDLETCHRPIWKSWKICGTRQGILITPFLQPALPQIWTPTPLKMVT